MPTRRSALLAVWALWMCAAIGALAVFGGVVAPLDVLTTLAPALILAPPLLLFVARPLRTPFTVRAALACISVGAGLWLAAPDLAGAWPQGEAAPAKPGQATLKVVTLNVWDEGVNRQKEIEFLHNAQADVIILQEARAGFISRLGALADLYPTRVTCSEYPYCGVVILAKAPGRLLPGGARIDALEQPSRPYPAFTWRYAAVELAAPSSGGTIVVPIYAVHMKRGRIVGASARQLPVLAERLRGAKDHAIVAGDFNTTPWSNALRDFDGRVGVRRITHLLPTWPTPSRFGPLTPALIAIDHLYIGQAWRVVRVERGPDVGSDHYPVIAWLAATKTN